jgi:HK97 family phage prohead protease
MTTSKRERRFLESDVKLETREANQPRITGYAAKFNVRSVPLGNFVEQIDSHAFDTFLSANPPGDVVALWNHDENLPLGRRSAGNLTIGVDDVGLWYVVDPIPDTSYARDLVENLRQNIVKSSSFGFYADDEEWSKDSTTGQNVRTIKSARLFDVSPVLNPAYPDATSQLRAMFPDGVPTAPTDEDAARRFYRYMQLRVMSLTPRRTR